MKPDMGDNPLNITKPPISPMSLTEAIFLYYELVRAMDELDTPEINTGDNTLC